jgi:hypothetical protein
MKRAIYSSDLESRAVTDQLKVSQIFTHFGKMEIKLIQSISGE